MTTGRFFRGAVLVALLASVAPAHADTSGARLLLALDRLPDHGARFRERSAPARSVVRVTSRARAIELGLVPITERLAVVPRLVASAPAAELLGDVRFAPERALLLDRASETLRAPSAREDFGVDGSGVIVGLVDTGVDVAHPAFRNTDGTTRISWLLTFDEGPRGLHPELEEEYGCTDDATTGARCAIYAAADLDALLDPSDLELPPTDDVGHGTHVLSTAAGSDQTYPGVAPGAELVVVQAGGSTTSLGDGEILLGARFVFDRAAEEARPAVLNVSLGSSFGAHDGSSSLEEGLAELARGPGRVVVVAAGNDGGLYGGGTGSFPEPFGIHTEAHVPRGGEVRVPLLSPAVGRDALTGAVYVWIAGTSDLDVAFDPKRGRRTEFVEPGDFTARASSDLGDADDYDVVVLNGTDEGQDVRIPEGNTVVAIVGSWQAGREFELVLRGTGDALIWVQSAGQWAPSTTGTGVLVPRARTGGTVGIPASHPDLITVGATTNRLDWRDATGRTVTAPYGEIGELAVFSSAGPNRGGALKPDVVAPGEYLIAAMSSAADPRTSLGAASQFSSTALCESDEPCLVVDDQHGVSSGTSMAAPLVTGAVALLLAREPELTMAEARVLLRGGAAETPGETAFGSWTGAGTLDVRGSLLAQDLAASDRFARPSAGASRLVLGSTFLRPADRFEVLAILRDADGEPAGGFSSERLELDVSGATGEIETLGAGVARFSIRAPAGSGTESITVRVLFDGEELARETFPIGVDPPTARLGFDALGGSCGVARSRSASLPLVGWGLGLVLVLSGLLRRVRTSPVDGRPLANRHGSRAT